MYQKPSYFQNPRINRNIVECKCIFLQGVFLLQYELIETLWNVNEEYETPHPKGITELIETLWNVNEEKDKLSNNERVRINRNILECRLLS